MPLIDKSKFSPKGGPRGISEAQLAEALMKSGGIISLAAAALGIGDRSVRERLANHPELAKIQADADARVTDIAKAHIVKGVERGDRKDIHLWLTTKGGWSRRQEVTGPEGGAIVSEVRVTVEYVDGPSQGPEEDPI